MGQGFDAAGMGAALARPGMDTRQWVSFGTVSKETKDQKSVVFDAELGPLVMVDLHPSMTQVYCRVAGGCAGTGEGEYFPFISGDEVIVLIPEGNETAGCTIIGRLNNSLDTFPTMVAGNDTTKNNFAFRRMRTPYVIESESSYIVRSDSTKAFFGLTEAGDLVFANADGAVLQLGADTIGFRNKDADVFVEVNVSNSVVAIQAGGSQIQVTSENVLIAGVDLLDLTGGLARQYGHAATAEAVLSFLQNFIPAFATICVSMIGAAPITNGTTLGNVILAACAGGAFQTAVLNAMLVGMAIPTPPVAVYGGNVSALIPALTTLMLVPQANTPYFPLAGSKGVLIS